MRGKQTDRKNAFIRSVQDWSDRISKQRAISNEQLDNAVMVRRMAIARPDPTHQHDTALGGLKAKHVGRDQLQRHGHISRREHAEERARTEEEEVPVSLAPAPDLDPFRQEQLERLEHALLLLLRVGCDVGRDVRQEDGAEDGGQYEEAEGDFERGEVSEVSICQSTACSSAGHKEDRTDRLRYSEAIARLPLTDVSRCST